MARESENIKKRMVRLIGVAYLLLGFIFILQSFRGITGFVIVEEVPQEVGWLIGLAFIAVGIFVLMAARDKYNLGRYTLRREGHKQFGAEYHCSVYYRGRRTDLNTIIDDENRVYIGKHGRGVEHDHHSIGRDNLAGIARRTKELLEGRPTRKKGSLKDPEDITDYL